MEFKLYDQGGITMKRETRIQKQLEEFEQFLKREEKSPATCEKYMRDVRGFLIYLAEDKGCHRRRFGRKKVRDRKIEEEVLAYKQQLIDADYSPSTVNGKLTAIRVFLEFEGVGSVKVKNLRVQRRAYVSEKKMLTREEYERLVSTARSEGKRELKLIIETLGATGMRVSELQYMTVEAVKQGEISISLKGKTREILISHKLRKVLLRFAKEESIDTGPIFINGRGDPMHRSQIWQMMKALAEEAGVDPARVYPHNLRRLFARSFYKVRKDIAKLADVLGHSSIDTTRIYIATTADEHLEILDELGLVT